MLQHLLNESVKLADSNNHIVVIKFLRSLEQVLIDGFNEPSYLGSKCTYELYKDRYVAHKIMFNRIKEALDMSWANHWTTTDELRYKSLMDNFHRTMYLSVCGKCPTCKARKKPWPDSMVIPNSGGYTVGELLSPYSELVN